ncbi:hypothetical protein L1987_20918 [Smallanthus sonchifolius]|uniref:Uncharacterized protein n=1 Tax=Smallanthus sonchifolius TaxID=185202 RepID=A0ACB9IT52_9ASTR|nr:hypothetical protein L1987_20918 [Smallanthus sonchifolius]
MRTKAGLDSARRVSNEGRRDARRVSIDKRRYVICIDKRRFEIRVSIRFEIPCVAQITKLHDALHLFDQMLKRKPPPSILEFNRQISVIVRMGHYSTALSLFKKVNLMGISSDVYAININCHEFIFCINLLEEPHVRVEDKREDVPLRREEKKEVEMATMKLRRDERNKLSDDMIEALTS